MQFALKYQSDSSKVKSLVSCFQIVAKTMIKNKKPGAIVNISSQVSKRATVAQAVYGASKGALDNLTKTMVLELGPHQVDKIY